MSVEQQDAISAEEKEAALQVYLTEEVAGTSQLLPGTTLTRMGEVNLGFSLKERLIDFYTVHKPSQQIDLIKLAAAYEADQTELNLALLKQYGENLETPRFATVRFSIIQLEFQQYWHELNVHAQWKMQLENGEHTVTLVHPGAEGGDAVVMIDNDVVSEDHGESNNWLLPAALWDGGCSFSFPFCLREFRIDVRLIGSLFDDQYFTYHLYVDDQPVVPCGTPGSLAAQFEEAVALMKKFRPREDLTSEEKLKLYSLYMQATEGDCTDAAPGMLDLTRKESWRAWMALEGVSKTDAMADYIVEAMRQEQLNSSDPSRVGPDNCERYAAPKPDGAAITESQLFAFYAARDVTKLPNVRHFADSYSTADLERALLARWGQSPEPQQPRITRGSLMAFYHKHDPAKATNENVEMLATKYAPAELQQALKTKYKECPAAVYRWADAGAAGGSGGGSGDGGGGGRGGGAAAAAAAAASCAVCGLLSSLSAFF